MNSVIRYFPLIFVIYWFVAVLVFRARATKRAEGRPDLLAGRDQIIRAFVVYFGGSWFFFCAGSAFGLFRVFAFPPRGGGVTWFDLLYYLIGEAVALRLAYWMFLRGGASFLYDHRQLFDKFPEDPDTVKLLCGMLVLVSLISGSVQIGWAFFHRGAFDPPVFSIHSGK